MRKGGGGDRMLNLICFSMYDVVYYDICCDCNVLLFLSSLG